MAEHDFPPDGRAADGDDGYVALRVDAAACPAALREDLEGMLAAQWLAEYMRAAFERAAYGAPVYGPLGTFDGVLAEAMPNYWRDSGERGAGLPVWVPDGRHPVGKWLADVGASLPKPPDREALEGILRRHGIAGTRDALPSLRKVDGGFALMVHRPKAAALKVPGVARDDALAGLWAPTGG